MPAEDPDDDLEACWELVRGSKPVRGVRGSRPVFTVICQDWEESERGWGQRADGFTLHLTRSDRDYYVKQYNLTYNNEATVPDVYTRACGEPRSIKVNEATHNKLLEQLTRKTSPDWQRHGIAGEGIVGPKA